MAISGRAINFLRDQCSRLISDLILTLLDLHARPLQYAVWFPAIVIVWWWIGKCIELGRFSRTT